MIDLTSSRAFTRRAFLARGLTLASTVGTVPLFLSSSARVLAGPIDAPSGSRPGVPEDRILVVIQLAGGNDGLNTVVPYGDAAYHRARPGIGITEKDVLKLGTSGRADGIGLHPRLTGFKQLYDDGLLTVVQGVGYPNPNRSHFKSMDIWHTADTGGTGDGWIGRYFDNQCAGSPAGAKPVGAAAAPPDAAPTTSPGCCGHAGVAIGRTAPLAMQGRRYKPVSFETPDLFRWTGLGDGDEAAAKAYRSLQESAEAGGAAPLNAAEEFLTRTALDAQIASDRIRSAVGLQPLVAYSRSQLAQQLAMVAAMIRAGLETRVYYLSLGGFDTHAGQGAANGAHANLMEQLGSALLAFYNDLKAQGNDSRVLTMSFSEFGRRVGQNGSGGTDHGTAAPMFLAGPMVRAGVLGDHPSLTDLDNGDLKFGVDFRCVYAGILDGWLRADSQAVLGRRFQSAKVLSKA